MKKEEEREENEEGGGRVKKKLSKNCQKNCQKKIFCRNFFYFFFWSVPLASKCHASTCVAVPFLGHVVRWHLKIVIDLYLLVLARVVAHPPHHYLDHIQLPDTIIVIYSKKKEIKYFNDYSQYTSVPDKSIWTRHKLLRKRRDKKKSDVRWFQFINHVNSFLVSCGKNNLLFFS